MKYLSRAVAVAGLLALGACGGGASENVAVNNSAGDELYNLAPDDLGGDNLLGNEAIGNELDAGNAADANAAGNAQ